MANRRRGDSLVTTPPVRDPDVPPPYAPAPMYAVNDAVEEAFEKLLCASPVPSLHMKDVLLAAAEEARQLRVYLRRDVVVYGKVRCVRHETDGLFTSTGGDAWTTYFFAEDVVAISIYDATKEVGS